MQRALHRLQSLFVTLSLTVNMLSLYFLNPQVRVILHSSGYVVQRKKKSQWLRDVSINQSIHRLMDWLLYGQYPHQGQALQPNQCPMGESKCSTRHQQVIGHASVYRKRPNKREVFSDLPGHCNWGSQTATWRELLPQGRATRANYPCVCDALDPGSRRSDSLMWSQWARWDWCG